MKTGNNSTLSKEDIQKIKDFNYKRLHLGKIKRKLSLSIREEMQEDTLWELIRAIIINRISHPKWLGPAKKIWSEIKEQYKNYAEELTTIAAYRDSNPYDFDPREGGEFLDRLDATVREVGEPLNRSLQDIAIIYIAKSQKLNDLDKDLQTIINNGFALLEKGIFPFYDGKYNFAVYGKKPIIEFLGT